MVYDYNVQLGSLIAYTDCWEPERGAAKGSQSVLVWHSVSIMSIERVRWH